LYRSDRELPENVKKLSKDLRKKWRRVWNAAFRFYGDEERAFAVAWASVAGHRKKGASK
jgi:cation transport regulator ChaB